MASIFKRTAFVCRDSDGILRPSDWSSVVTSLGQMVEPGREMFPVKATNTPVINVDRGDEIARVDRIDIINLDAEKVVLSGGEDTYLHGGVCIPRDGR